MNAVIPFLIEVWFQSSKVFLLIIRNKLSYPLWDMVHLHLFFVPPNNLRIDMEIILPVTRLVADISKNISSIF